MTSSVNKDMKNNSTINSVIVIVDDLEKGTTTTLPLSSSSPLSLKRIIGVFVLLSLCGFAAIQQQGQQGQQGRHRSLASIGGDMNNVNADGSSNSSPATELKVVQRKVEPQNNEGSLVGSNELIRVTTKTNALFGSSFDIIYATRVQRRWRRSTTEEGDRVVEGLEIVKTYRVLDGIAGIEFPTSTVKSTIRLTRTYPTRPPNT